MHCCRVAETPALNICLSWTTGTVEKDVRSITNQRNNRALKPSVSDFYTQSTVVVPELSDRLSRLKRFS